MKPDVTPQPAATPSQKKFAIPKLAMPKLAIPKIAIPKLAIPKKLMLPAIAVAVLLTVGGVVGVLHARAKPAPPTHVKAARVAIESSTTCAGVVRDLYSQARDDDPSITLAEVRAEVRSTGIDCKPVPALAAALKDLSPACRDMVQYTYLEVSDGHPNITVTDVRPKVVKKSIACDRDRAERATPPTRLPAARDAPRHSR